MNGAGTLAHITGGRAGDQHIRIGYLSTLYHTAPLLRGTTLLQEQGLEAAWRLFASGPDIINAMREDRVDLGYIGLPPAIIGIDRGLNLACIAGGHIEGTVIIAVDGTRSLAACRGMCEFLSQFTGRAIGTPPKGSIHDVIVTDLLREHGIDDVAVRQYAWADFLPDALASGEIAAAAGTPALGVTARHFGNADIVVPPNRLWPFNPSYGIVVMRDLLSRTEMLAGFLSAHESACEMIRHDPDHCAAVVAGVVGVADQAFIREIYGVSPKYCASLPEEYVASTMKFVETLHTLGYISRLVGKTEIFDRSLIDRLHPAPHHYSSGLLR